MRNIDENVLQAQQDKHYLEEFIKEYEVFILHTAHNFPRRVMQVLSVQSTRKFLSISIFYIKSCDIP